MSALTTHRKAERFAQVIDIDALPLFLDGGDPSLRPAVTLTAALRSAAHDAAPAPLSADTKLEMRQRLVAAANTSAAASTAGRANSAGRRIGRRASALVGSVVVLTSVTGVGVAAARSLPGSPFYDIKRATESVQLWLASGSQAKGAQHLEFARARLAEARALGADSPDVASTLRSMNQETRQGSSDLIAAYRSSGDNEPLADLVTFTRKQYADLARFGDAAGNRLQAQTVYSMTLLAGVAQQVQSVAGTTCLTCIVNGTKPRPTPANGGGHHSARPAPSATESTPGSKPSTSVSPSTPAPRPTDLLPTGLFPSRLPTKLPTLPPLLDQHNGKNGKGADILPTLSPLPLLSAITGLLSNT
jgi:hypothetical protein